jgi:hypothetical protein
MSTPDPSDTGQTTEPSQPCNADTIDALVWNPSNGNTFWQCQPYGWQLMPCPAGLVFKEGADFCDYPDQDD